MRTALSLTALLHGDDAEPEQPSGETTLNALGEHARSLSRQGALTFLRAPRNWRCTSRRMNDRVRDSCLVRRRQIALETHTRSQS